MSVLAWWLVVAAVGALFWAVVAVLIVEAAR